MAVIHGKKGTVTIGAAVGYARNWTLNTTVEVADTSHFGNEWREFIPGMGTWTATVESLFEPIDPGLVAIQGDVFNDPVGNQVRIDLATGGTGGKIYSGSGIVTGYSHTTDIGDAQVVALDIQGTGDIRIA